MRKLAGVRVGLVGAGFIAATHVEALAALPGVAVAAIIDPNIKAAERLAGKAPGAKVFGSLAEAVTAAAIDRVHVLVPPHLHHAVAAQALNAGLPTLVEKPLAVSPAEAAALVQLAQEKRVTLGVNHNFMFVDGLARFAAELERGAYGRLRHVSMICAVPLRQLAAKQFGHWMFERPANIVLEQMVHPLSQLVRLMGRLSVTSAVARPAVELGPGLKFHQSFDVAFNGGAATAQLHMAFGEAYPAWLLNCVCDDGMIVIDGTRNQVLRYRRTRFLEQGDTALTSAAAGLSQLGQAGGGLFKYAASQLKLLGRADPFYQSMLASIGAFHQAVDQGRAPLSDGVLGTHLVDLCAGIGRLAGVSDEPVAPPRSLVKRTDTVPAFDVALFGGTGFIGKVAVEQLVAKGFSVGVMARSMRGMPDVFQSERVTLLEGDVTKRDDVVRGIGRAKFVVNLAHGGAGGSRDAIVDALAGSCDIVAETCLTQGVGRLVYISSIAALYLGDSSETVTPSTLADPMGPQRGDYSFAKAEAERLLLSRYLQKGLNFSIQRPGIVVGEGASPFHSGLGLFNNDQHCLGWTDGRNRLPFVLVEDCASAIVCALASDAKLSGRADNIVGPVQMTAREYIDELARALGRPLKFHSGAIWKMQSVEIAKWLIKRAGGRSVSLPSSRDLRSRGMRARFDTSETERVLNWHPTSSRATFVERGIHAPARAFRLE